MPRTFVGREELPVGKIPERTEPRSLGAGLSPSKEEASGSPVAGRSGEDADACDFLSRKE